jgi:sulfopyruvate decarboxylase TPP-binding subunit
VPDRVLASLIKGLHADPFFICFPSAREEEAAGIVSGAWMGGMLGAVLMQTSGLPHGRVSSWHTAPVRCGVRICR